jgi:hypothetical protein
MDRETGRKFANEFREALAEAMKHCSAHAWVEKGGILPTNRSEFLLVVASPALARGIIAEVAKNLEHRLDTSPKVIKLIKSCSTVGPFEALLNGGQMVDPVLEEVRQRIDTDTKFLVMAAVHEGDDMDHWAMYVVDGAYMGWVEAAEQAEMLARTPRELLDPGKISRPPGFAIDRAHAKEGLKVLLTEKCHFCGAAKAKFRCSECKVAHYCNAECQRKGWPTHKLLCAGLRVTVKSMLSFM